MLKQDRLHDICNQAYEHATDGTWKPGSNYWMVMFSGYVKEKLDEDFTLIKKNIKDLSHLIDFDDGLDD